MNGFESKFEELSRITNELDGHIWNIFDRYIKEEKINFNYPKGWGVDGDTIHFHGEDGCMGCYDRMSINIPFKFFINPDAEFDCLAEQREKESKKKDDEGRKRKEVAEKKEFKRLKSKYD